MTPLSLHIPLSTYRLQFNSSFTFQDASRILPYLSQLGITDCYASPYLKAAPGSTHGYDVVDPTELNPEIGTETEYQAFIQALHQHGMGQILDVVPNHMGIAGSTNL
ncbi:MAG TPA: alpha-amylase family glycosyl hydrolase, partial [Nitrospirales bacterium]|nr:alpha-amylase family glycosyl hydrolase [Nitrospirales bacterium]